MKKIFLFCASVLFSTMMFAQVMIWKDGEVIYRKNIDEVDRVSFCEVEDFSLLKDTIELEYYGDLSQSRKWIHAEFTPKNSYGLLEYTSSDERVVTVSYDGYVISRGVGEAVVTVKLLGTDIERSCKVIVKGFSGIFVWNETIYLAPKQSYSAEKASWLFYPYCYMCEEKLVFESSDETIVKIAELNNFVALSLGETVITATLEGTDISASAVVKVEDPELSLVVYDEDNMERDVDLVKMGKNGVKAFIVHLGNDNFEESNGNNIYLWESTNEDVVTFVDYNGVEYYNGVVAVGEGEADVIVNLRGTNESDTIRVVVTPTDPMTVEFKKVLYNENSREYPLGYDMDSDGNDDMVREVELWLLGGNLTWDEEKEAVVGEDYVICVKTACVYTGSEYYLAGRYDFDDADYEDDYLLEYEEEEYFIPYRASTSYLDTSSYCKYYETLFQSGSVKREDFEAQYDWPMKDVSSYVYYWDADNNDIHLAGLVNSGYFEIDHNYEYDYSGDRVSVFETENMQVSFMDVSLQFFADTPYGLLTEQKYDEDTGEMREDFVTPLQMAPFISRDVYSDFRYFKYVEWEYQNAPKTMQGISEKALKTNKLLNLPMQMKLQSISF